MKKKNHRAPEVEAIKGSELKATTGTTPHSMRQRGEKGISGASFGKAVRASGAGRGVWAVGSHGSLQRRGG